MRIVGLVAYSITWAEAYLRTKWNLDPSLIFQPFGHNRHGLKIAGGLLSPFFGGHGCPSKTMWPGPRPTAIPSGILIHPAVWPQQTWAENWAAVPLLGGTGFPSNTMWPGQRPTSVPSFILIHPTVWPQYTNVTDRQDRQDNGLIA